MKAEEVALEQAAAAVMEAVQALNAKVVGAYRDGIPISLIARFTGLHAVGVRRLLAEAGEPLSPR